VRRGELGSFHKKNPSQQKEKTRASGDMGKKIEHVLLLSLF